ncbi:MAG: hypothetical protein ACPF9D_13970 [Owenweeksia sp.]
MRVLGTIPHPHFKIVAYTLDQHFYVEIEAGPMKQCHKLHKEQVNNLEGIRKWLDQTFMDETYKLFEQMYTASQNSLKRNLKI